MSLDNLYYAHVGIAPAPDIVGGPDITVAAGAPATFTLDARGSVCFFTPCTYAFSVTCNGVRKSVKQGPSNTATFSVGLTASQDINLLNTPGGSCTYALAMTDSYFATTGFTNTYTGNLQASQPLVWNVSS